jgi:hypothetical protein
MSKDIGQRRRAQVSPSARELALALNGHRIGEGRYIARCPCHDDRRPSLSIVDGHCGRPVDYCFAGCDWRDVLDRLSMGQWPRFEPKARR